MFDKDSSVKFVISRNVGSILLFVINHVGIDLQKKSNSAKTIRWNTGNIFPIKKHFKIDQWICELILWSDNLLASIVVL